VPSQQLQGQLEKQHSLDIFSTAPILIIPLQRKRSIKTTATRPVPDTAQWKTTISALYNKEKHKGNRDKKNNTNKQ
jgi:hypothetical protein